MKKLFLHSLVLLFFFCLSSCDETQGPTEQELTSTQIEINGKVYEIVNKTHSSWNFEQDGQTLTNHQFMIMGPEIHMSVFMRKELVGTTIDLTKEIGADMWTVICAGNADAETYVEASGNSALTDDFGAGSYLTTESSGDNYNLAFKIIKSDGSITLRAVIKGGFEASH
ncbi:MAG: hypothetical protein SOZ00_07065 [Tidjanibacter sp.]|nr:hypothetical protein [Tidjanibacter sp.]